MDDADIWDIILKGIGVKDAEIQEARIFVTRLMVLWRGREMLGAPGKKVAAALEAIADLDRLEQMHQRLGDAKSWKELLADK